MAKPTSVIFRGVRMIEGWPEKIAAAQTAPNCTIGGIEMSRIRYGDESGEWGANSRPCHDCGVIKGELHVEGCDVERCAGCGEQRFGCDCESTSDDGR
jgi:hypothetical protein